MPTGMLSLLKWSGKLNSFFVFEKWKWSDPSCLRPQDDSLAPMTLTPSKSCHAEECSDEESKNPERQDSSLRSE